MTINDKDKFMAALWDWGFLDGCFDDTGIRVSDLDGIVERKGHLLFIEAKPTGKGVSTGQNRMFNELTNLGFHVVVIWGETNEPDECLIMCPHQLGGQRIKLTADRRIAPEIAKALLKAKIAEMIRRWFVWANHFPRRGLKGERWPLTLNLFIEDSEDGGDS